MYERAGGEPAELGADSHGSCAVDVDDHPRFAGDGDASHDAGVARRAALRDLQARSAERDRPKPVHAEPCRVAGLEHVVVAEQPGRDRVGRSGEDLGGGGLLPYRAGVEHRYAVRERCGFGGVA